jgi:D-alanyl-D-alanine carboxypeptidase
MTQGWVAPRRWLAVAMMVLMVLAGAPSTAVAGWRSTWPEGPYEGLGPVLQGVLADARQAGVPGISAAIVTPDGRWTGVIGTANVSSGQRVTPETAFEAGSVTKTFVAAVVLQLVEEGKLSLSEKVSRYIRGIPNGSRITIRHLLSHTSGLRDLFDDPATQRAIDRRPRHHWTFAQVVRHIGRPRGRPGGGYHYSNANYILLGRIVERVDDRDLARSIRVRLLRPLGLTHTWFQGEEAAPPGMWGRRAMGYARRGGRWDPYGDGSGLRPTTSMATFIWAAGAMMSTPTDLARWARALYGTDEVLRPASLELMTSFGRKDYGLGVRRAIKGDREAWGHGGSLDGFQTGMWYLPRLRAAVSLMWNRWPHETGNATRRLAERLVDRLDPDTEPPVMRGGLRIGIRSGTTVTGASVPLGVEWTSAADGLGTLAGYTLQRQVGEGAWLSVPLGGGTARSATVRVPVGDVVRFRLRARDDEGNASDWVLGPRMRAEIVGEADAAVQTDAAWRPTSAAGSLGGSVLTSDVTGSAVSLSAEGVRAMAVISVRAASRGRLAVSWDDGSESISRLAGTPRTPRWIAAGARWSSPGTHEIRIRVGAGTPARVDIDGFVLLRAVAE